MAARKPAPPEELDDEFAPWRNGELAGHGEAERTLLGAWNSGRLPHAWLISGPKGIGKATLAYRFTRFVLSRGGPEFDASQETMFADPEAPQGLQVDANHPACLQIAQRAHPGLRVIEKSWDDKNKRLRGEIVVDDVRGAIRVFAMTAEADSWRVVIVDAADEMNVNAANALLKTLEEPPHNGLLLLISHNPGRLLPTIRSRCRTLALKPLEEDDVLSIIAARNPDAAPDALTTLVRLADGSPGRAFGLMEEGGPALYEDLIGMLRDLPDIDAAGLHKLADRLARRDAAEAYATFMSLLGWWLTRMVRHAAMGQRPPEIIAGDADLAAALTARRGLEHWIEVWEKISRLAARADSVYLDRKQVLLNVFSMLEKAARA